MRINKLVQFIIVLFSLGMISPLAFCADMQIIPIEVKTAADNVWGKERLVSEMNDGVIRITDNEAGDFNDASLWEIRFNAELPYGRKILSFELEVGERHKPLWDKSVLSPLINGTPAVAASEINGIPAYQAITADDGRPYVPLGTSPVRLTMEKKSKALRSFSFVLAGASSTDIRMSGFKIHVWPEDDPGSTLQGPIVSQLPFLPKAQKLVLYESGLTKKADATTELSIDVQGPNGSSTALVKLDPKRSLASKSIVSIIDLSQIQTIGEYRVTVPPYAKQTKSRNTNFAITSSPEALLRARNDAWGAFYWITDNQNGPYKDAHKQDQFAAIFGDEKKRKDVRGGWFDAGDYGKYTVNGAYSAALVLLTGLLAPEALEHPITPLAGGSDSQPDWLSVVETELIWLLTMQNEDGGVHHKVATQNFPGMNISPRADEGQKWIMPVTSTATADFAAVMSLAAMAYRKLPDGGGKLRARLFEDAAKRAQAWLLENPKLTMIKRKYDGINYGGAYFDDDDTDERLFAEAALAVLSNEEKALKKVQAQIKDSSQKVVNASPVLDWRSVELLAYWTLKLSPKAIDPPTRKLVDKVLDNAASSWGKIKQRTPWRISLADQAEFPWGSNGVLATTGWHWLLWSRITGNAQFRNDARDQLHWFFGRNPLAKTFVTGPGPRDVKAPHFRPWTSKAIKLPSGFLVGGPNSGEASKKDFDVAAPMRMYEDESKSYTTNEVAINWQVAWALYLSLASVSP